MKRKELFLVSKYTLEIRRWRKRNIKIVKGDILQEKKVWKRNALDWHNLKFSVKRFILVKFWAGKNFTHKK